MEKSNDCIEKREREIPISSSVTSFIPFFLPTRDKILLLRLDVFLDGFPTILSRVLSIHRLRRIFAGISKNSSRNVLFPIVEEERAQYDRVRRIFFQLCIARLASLRTFEAYAWEFIVALFDWVDRDWYSAFALSWNDLYIWERNLERIP